MKYETFLKLLYANVNNFGMPCGIGEKEDIISTEPNEEAWFVCSDCAEIIYWCDWKNDKNANSFCCPICGCEIEDYNEDEEENYQ